MTAKRSIVGLPYSLQNAGNSYRGPLGFTTSGGCYWKMGVYRSSKTAAGAAVGETMTIAYSNFAAVGA